MIFHTPGKQTARETWKYPLFIFGKGRRHIKKTIQKPTNSLGWNQPFAVCWFHRGKNTKTETYQLVFCGHSMGGALGAMCVAILRAKVSHLLGRIFFQHKMTFADVEIDVWEVFQIVSNGNLEIHSNFVSPRHKFFLDVFVISDISHIIWGFLNVVFTTWNHLMDPIMSHA